MAKEKEIHDIQQDHFSQTTSDWTDHYQVDEKDLEKHLNKVEKEFMKVERENAAKNKKAYIASKIDKKRDDLYVIHHEGDKDKKSKTSTQMTQGSIGKDEHGLGILKR